MSIFSGSMCGFHTGADLFCHLTLLQLWWAATGKRVLQHANREANRRANIGYIAAPCSVQHLPADLDESGITMSGPFAVLDGADFTITGPAPSETFGILLLGGATAINCDVSGFGGGIIMDGGDNLVQDSSFTNNGDGVIVIGDGCQTVDNVNSSGNESDGIDINATGGTVVLQDILANENGDDGIKISNEVAESLLMYVENVEANSNLDDGIDINADGDMTIEFYGVTANENTDDGFDVENNGGTMSMVFSSETNMNDNGDDGFFLDSDGDASIEFAGVANFNNNGDDGFQVEDGDSGGVVSVIFSGETTSASFNGDDGFDLDHDGDFSLDFFGTSTIRNNGDEGFDHEPDSTIGRITFHEVAFILNNAGNGIDPEDEGTVTFGETSISVICNNGIDQGEVDLDGEASDYTVVAGAQVACQSGFTCGDCFTALSEAVFPTLP